MLASPGSNDASDGVTVPAIQGPRVAAPPPVSWGAEMSEHASFTVQLEQDEDYRFNATSTRIKPKRWWWTQENRLDEAKGPMRSGCSPRPRATA
jgi:hypothetical protein